MTWTSASSGLFSSVSQDVQPQRRVNVSLISAAALGPCLKPIDDVDIQPQSDLFLYRAVENPPFLHRTSPVPQGDVVPQDLIFR